MSRACEITGKSVMSGNNVSHSNRKTRRKFRPNLQKVTLMSDVLGHSYKMRICVSTLRSVDINGGLDSYLLSMSTNLLSEKARKIKNAIISKKAKKIENAVISKKSSV